MRYTYVRQHDTTDCAAACLAMVCLHYKKEITITRLRDMMGTDLKGTNLTGMEKAAQELGFSTAAVRVDRENFLSEFTTPCIAQVITDEGLAHFVTVFKKTTIKDDGERRRHMVRQEEERKKCADEGKKFKCRDYVIIGDPAKELKKISLDEFYKNFTGVLLLMTPTSEFKTGKQKQGSMVKRFLDLLWPQKKLFFYAILSSVILTIIGIASSMYNKILMDEILPYGLKSLLVAVILVFSIVSVTSALISMVRQWVLIYLSIKVDIPLMLGYFGHVFKLPMKFHPLLRRQHHQIGVHQHRAERRDGHRDGLRHRRHPLPDECHPLLHFDLHHPAEHPAGVHLQAALQADQRRDHAAVCCPQQPDDREPPGHRDRQVQRRRGP